MTPDLVTSLIYVSRKTLPAPKNAEAINDILLVSRERNKFLQVTGALFSASNTFAQFIEGPKLAIDQLMESITRDARHRDVKVVSVKDDVPRKFPDWTMAYSGDEHTWTVTSADCSRRFPAGCSRSSSHSLRH